LPTHGRDASAAIAVGWESVSLSGPGQESGLAADARPDAAA